MRTFSFLDLFRVQEEFVSQVDPALIDEPVASDSTKVAAPGDFFGMNFIDDEFYKMLFKFGFTLLILFVIIRLLYYPATKRKDYLFTYFLISVITFFICYTLQDNKLKLGLGLGLFAIFGIIKYRTDAIPIKEMTYLFIVIGLSVINALSNKDVSFAGLVFTNLAVVAIVFGLERVWLLKHESAKIVLYEKIEMIKPQNRDALKLDLEQRTGIKINRIAINKIDFLRDTAQIIIFYYDAEQGSDYSKKDTADDDD
ncbi:MAG: DUF4956 domain-containing protein [Bacteroidota bacterium]